MQRSTVALDFGDAALGAILMFAIDRVVDWLTPHVDDPEAPERVMSPPSHEAPRSPFRRPRRDRALRARDSEKAARRCGIETVAPTVPRWRYRETLGYVRRINVNLDGLSGKRP